ncbi:hypothetical protein [Chryseobacterium sp. OV279]|uniref:hypothetical protein n=1 Tax=Chryseobacterium sp. OV279 TaxID=1500285 RepID=UPI000912F98E|nr:hypothetical protein [Chryseobacterium sp. OV279]SHF78898.1 hypothetical protein SAMN02787100_2597 [Chryseobacterium sp. OV279]
MFREILIVLFFVPLLLTAQQKTNQKCKDVKRGAEQLPCKITNRYSIDIIPDKETAVKYADMLISNRELLSADKAKPYLVNLINDNKIWQVIIKSYNCRSCKIYININKNTGEILNFYKVED